MISKCSEIGDLKDISDTIKTRKLIKNVMDLNDDDKFELPIPSPETRDDHVKNMKYIIHFLQNGRIRIIGINADDIVDKNNKILLGFIWTIILRYETFDKNAMNNTSRLQSIDLDNPEIKRLNDLHNSGFIQNEEYEMRLKELSGSSAGAPMSDEEESHNMFYCSCSRFPCRMCGQRVKECCEDDHGNVCPAREYLCYYCENFKGDSLGLFGHMKKCRENYIIELMDKTIDYKVPICDKCGQSIFATEYIEGHKSMCEGYVECPTCGYRDDYSKVCEHISSCPKNIMSCMICHEEIRFGDFQNHKICEGKRLKCFPPDLLSVI